MGGTDILIVDKRIYYSGVSHRARTVYCYLCDKADKKGQCWPTVMTIALDLAISTRTVYRALKDLEQDGFIIRQKQYIRRGEPAQNLYSLKGIKTNY